MKFIDVTTEELVAELMDRFDHVVFNGRKDSDKGIVELKDYQGDTTILLGLCLKLSHSISQEPERQEDGFQ